MELFGVVLLGVVAVLAWCVARTRREHRPIAAFVTLALGADLVHWALRAHVLAPARAALGDAPYAGAVRVAFHVQQAAVVAFPVGLAGLGLVVFLRRRLWPGLLAYAAIVGLLAARYPALRREALELAYRRIDAAVVLFLLGTFVTWLARGERASITIGSLLVLGVIQAGKLVAWHPVAEWETFAAVLYAVGFVALAVVHMGELWLRRNSA